MTLSEFLTARRIRQGDFADSIGVNQSYVSKLVSGARVPSMRVAHAIARVTSGAVPVEVWLHEGPPSENAEVSCLPGQGGPGDAGAQPARTDTEGA